MEEFGWFCPGIGYWQSISWPDDETRAAYPPGTVQVPLKPMPTTEYIDWTWSGSEWIGVPRPAEPAP
ncbi:hypothetical protein [Rhizobium straminoryzae]|uniref:Uncharacterized protein n=1 Tax=Rhizobium straminoryzae TaxID=1387186 RepID=A0A549TCV7_9HYPH|nr:hypothetical protein [Rhizobium straminoryzae]TRL39822.1 hypothetical protein FNA46_07760 [Rhizobium straminoryzae]